MDGKHLINGTWHASEERFFNSPVSGEAMAFSSATVEQTSGAVDAAVLAAAAFASTSAADRATFLETIASEIEARGAELTEAANLETGLPPARLEGERARTCGQLKSFAELILSGEHLDLGRDPALPDRAPQPRPDLRVMQLPVGPVAVFGSSNFPLAFSVAGGDTASALAAGCPVVVKAHPAHPRTSEIVAEAIHTAIVSTGMPKAVFSMVQSDRPDISNCLVDHPEIQAVGFTGSLRVGRILFDRCSARPVPIPFFGELGSINPVFVMPKALKSRGEEIAKGWVGSLTLGAGQFCTNPGIVVLKEGQEADAFLDFAVEQLRNSQPQTMLTTGITSAYQRGRDQVLASAAKSVFSGTEGDRVATGDIFSVSAEQWMADHTLSEEVFGPLGLIITVQSEKERSEIASSLEGQLTCTLHVDEADAEDARALLPILTRKAGRVIANGFPTGVEVAPTMIHGGPYPASTNFGHTSVGTRAIRRWLRPVCFQDMPVALLPEELRKLAG